MNLDYVLGKGWQENSFSPDISVALADYGIQTINDGREVLEGEARSDAERFVVDANDVFKANGSSYKAKVLEAQNGEQSVFITGMIGKDTFYQVAKYMQTDRTPKGQKMIAWMAGKFGLIGPTGEVFALDAAISHSPNADATNFTAFVEIAGRKYSGNIQLSSGEDSDTLTYAPERIEQLGTYLHELGHQVRDRAFKRTDSLINSSNLSHDEFSHIAKTGSIFNPNAKLTPYQTRKIKANEERGAWALGLSILKEAGSHINLDSASLSSRKQIISWAEYALSTYDKVPYAASENPDSKTIPTFSQAQRIASEKLRESLKNSDTSYKDLPNFDDITGEPIGNNPVKILENRPS